MNASAAAVNIGIDCPKCATDGRKTSGGATPTVRLFIDRDGSESYRCMGTHGALTFAEVSEGVVGADAMRVANAIADGKARLHAAGVI